MSAPGARVWVCSWREGVDSINGPTAAMATAGLRTEAGSWRREMIGKKWRNFQRDGVGLVGP